MGDFALPVITIDGAYLYKGEERFIVRGLVYQVRSTPRDGARSNLGDPLDDSHYEGLVRDVQAFRELGVNALWIYHTDPGISRTRCMNLLAENGIYAIFALSSSTLAINRLNPQESYQKEDLIQHFCSVVDSVAPYSNTLGVSIADQLVNQGNVDQLNNLEECWTVMAKVVGHVKKYMRYRNHDVAQRVLPVCISDGQWSAANTSTFNYLADPEVEGRAANGRVDFYCFSHFGRTIERHRLPRTSNKPDCESIPPTRTTALSADSVDPIRWRETLPMQKFADAEDLVPILISEYGNTRKKPRMFNEVGELYGKNMSSPLLRTLSGGFAYEFYDASNRYGLVMRGDHDAYTKLMDFYNFRNVMYEAIGTTQPDIRRSMMTASDRPIHLVLDFDGTLTKKDTLRLVAGAGYKRQTMDAKTFPPTPWHDIVKAYEADYSEHEIEYGRAGLVRTSASDEFAWLDSLSQVETASANRVYAAGIFDNVTKQDMELAAADATISRQIELRPGWASLFAQIKMINKRASLEVGDAPLVQVLSVNWSRWFIWNVLNKGLLALSKSQTKTTATEAVEKLAVYANEVPSVAAQYDQTPDSSTTPCGDQMTLRTAGDKLKQMQVAMSNFAELQLRPLTIYVGDSVTDLQCMLMADVGICIKDSLIEYSLRLTCERLGVKIVSLSVYKESERPPAPSIQELEKAIAAEQVTLYYAQDLNEIADWIAELTSGYGLSSVEGEPSAEPEL